MFTIKLYLSPTCYEVIETSHYNVSHVTKDVTEITIYGDFTTQKGTTYRIANELEVPHYKGAFVENSAGKTIERFKSAFIVQLN